MLKQPLCRARGVTAIELLVVVSIVAIMMTIGVPSLQNWIASSRVRLKAEGVLNGLQYARAEAIRRNARIFFSVNGDSSWSLGCATVVGDLDGDGSADCPSVIQSKSALEGGAGVVLTISPNGATTATFTGLGLVATNADGSASLTQIDFSSLGTAQKYRIPLTSGGQTRICDPDVAIDGDPRKC